MTPSRFLINIYSPPLASISQNAYQFTQSCLELGHKVMQVFFFGDGVYHANENAMIENNASMLTKQWSALAEQYDLPLIACSNSSLTRGILDITEANRYDKPASTLAPAFRLGGLGVWTEACLQADKVMNFG